MLEDRKFFHAVGAKESPWTPVGPAEAVVMVSENSYVGEHTPRIQLPGDGKRCGIFQDGLGLIKGNKYTGRIIIAGSPEAAPVKVSLVWGQERHERATITIPKIKRNFVKVPLSFKAKKSTDNGRLEIVGLGSGTFRIGTVSLMPADNINGMRADTLKLLKELDSPIYRWPGGNFVSGYDWRDGIGERDKRPPRRNLAWPIFMGGLEQNDFGLDEFITFCRLLGTEPMITVNTGFGDDHSAAEEVEYANGSPDTPMGKWRADNGHRQPYDVKWWCVGNEMWGTFQLGYMHQNHYVIKHNLFARAMRKVDPSIKLIAPGIVGEWDEKMLTTCADYMELIAEHFYCGEKKPVVEHVRQIPEAVRGKVVAHRDYRKRLESLKGRDIRIAMTEWNYGPLTKRDEMGLPRYSLRDALGIAAGLHEMIRNADLVFMATYSETGNAVGFSKTAAAFETNGLVLKLYRRRFGRTPVRVTTNVDNLDVSAAWTSDRKALTIGLVNPTEQKYELAMDLKGARLTGKGRLWTIAHSDPMAYNEPGKPPQVVIDEKPLSGVRDKLNAPPLSINLYKLMVQ